MSGGDRVLVPVPGLGVLALELSIYREALAAGTVLSPPAVTSVHGDEPLVDAEQLAIQLSLPVTWVEQAAREGRIPSIKAGRWVRFRRSAVEQALASGRSAK